MNSIIFLFFSLLGSVVQSCTGYLFRSWTSDRKVDFFLSLFFHCFLFLFFHPMCTLFGCCFLFLVSVPFFLFFSIDSFLFCCWSIVHLLVGFPGDCSLYRLAPALIILFYSTRRTKTVVHLIVTKLYVGTFMMMTML